MSNYPKFSKNEQLRGYYQSIGKALLAYESRAPFLLRSINERAFRDFRVGVSYIPNHVLDSFLEDLLDLTVSDRDLFVVSSTFSLQRLYVALPFIGLFGAMGIGLYLSTVDVPYTVCVFVTIAASLPCSILWEIVPRSSNRRLFFARLITAELSNRRGPRSGVFASQFEIDETLIPSLSREGLSTSVIAPGFVTRPNRRVPKQHKKAQDSGGISGTLG